MAETPLSMARIAEQVGVTERTIFNWKRDPDFNAYLIEIIEANSQEIRNIGVANLRTRLLALDERWKCARRIAYARARDDKFKDAPGGDTGFMLRKVRTVAGRAVADFVPDYALFGLLNDIELMAARTTGQLIVKHEHTGPNGKPIEMNVDLQELLIRRMERIAAQADGAEAPAGGHPGADPGPDSGAGS